MKRQMNYRKRSTDRTIGSNAVAENSPSKM